MAYEMNELSGTAFKNRNKVDGDRKPEYTGETKIDGKIYWFNMWDKLDKNGKPYFSFNMKEKDFTPAKEAAQKEQPKAHYNNDFDMDEVPF